MLAAAMGHVDIAKLLIANRADIFAEAPTNPPPTL